jgi:hypothetical protein
MLFAKAIESCMTDRRRETDLVSQTNMLYDLSEILDEGLMYDEEYVVNIINHDSPGHVSFVLKLKTIGPNPHKFFRSDVIIAPEVVFCLNPKSNTCLVRLVLRVTTTGLTPDSSEVVLSRFRLKLNK